MPNSVELRQQRARVVESMRTITEAAETRNENLTAEERQSYERHEQDFRSLSERITRQEDLEQRESELGRSLNDNTGRQTGTAEPTDEERAAQRRSAFLQFVRRGLTIKPEQRALVEDANGEILVPEDLEAEIYREIPAITVMRNLATVRPTVRDRVRRRSLTEVSVGWGKLETNDQDLTDSMPSTPGEEYSYVEDLYGLAKVGEDEFDDTDANLESFIRDSFTRAIGEAEDTAFAVGTGHANHQPLGVFSDTSIAAIEAASGTDISVDDFKALIYAVPAQYRRNGRFIMSSATELLLSTKKDDNGQYLWQPNVQAGRPNTFLGYGIANQEDAPSVALSAKVAAFGDYKAGYRVLDRRGLTVQRLVELYSEDGQIGFKVRFRVGGDTVRPNAIRVLQNAAA